MLTVDIASRSVRRQRSSCRTRASAARETFCRRVDLCGGVTPLDDDRAILRDINDPSLVSWRQVRHSDLRDATADDWQPGVSDAISNLQVHVVVDGS